MFFVFNKKIPIANRHQGGLHYLSLVKNSDNLVNQCYQRSSFPSTSPAKFYMQFGSSANLKTPYGAFLPRPNWPGARWVAGHR